MEGHTENNFRCHHEGKGAAEQNHIVYTEKGIRNTVLTEQEEKEEDGRNTNADANKERGARRKEAPIS